MDFPHEHVVQRLPEEMTGLQIVSLARQLIVDRAKAGHEKEHQLKIWQKCIKGRALIVGLASLQSSHDLAIGADEDNAWLMAEDTYEEVTVINHPWHRDHAAVQEMADSYTLVEPLLTNFGADLWDAALMAHKTKEYPPIPELKLFTIPQ